PRAIQRSLDIGGARGFAGGGGEGRLEIAGRVLFRIQGAVGQQRFGQGNQSGLGRDLRLVAAPLLVGQLPVFQPALVLRLQAGLQQFRRHLALLLDRRNDRGAPVFQFAQVTQAFLQQAQLDVVQPAGGFLAVARDEGHGRALVEQGDGGGNLGGFGG